MSTPPQATTGLDVGGTRLRCIELRSKGKGIRQIARILRIDHSTVCRHLQHPDAVAAIREATAGALEQAREDIRGWAPEVVDAAHKIAMGKERADPARVAAIKLLLNLAGLSETHKVELSGRVGIAALTVEQLAEEEARLQRDLKAIDGEAEVVSDA